MGRPQKEIWDQTHGDGLMEVVTVTSAGRHFFKFAMRNKIMHYIGIVWLHFVAFLPENVYMYSRFPIPFDQKNARAFVGQSGKQTSRMEGV